MANTTIIFQDYTQEVKSAIAGCAEAVLEECAGELESQVKMNTAVDTGQTKNSWQHKVFGSIGAGRWEAEIYSEYENAIWEEFGTGEHAINGDGRKGGWRYWSDKLGRFVFTRGKEARRPFHHAYTSLRDPIITHIQNAFRGL